MLTGGGDSRVNGGLRKGKQERKNFLNKNVVLLGGVKLSALNRLFFVYERNVGRTSVEGELEGNT